MSDVVAAEWRKLRSVPSTFYVVVSVAAIVAMSALVAWQQVSAWEAAAPARRAQLAAFRPEAGLLMFVQLALAALGVLTITGEYATGMIRTTFLATPQRGRVLGAKSVVVGAVALLLGLAGVLGMFLLSRLVIGDRAIPPDAPTLAEEALRLLGLGVSVLVVALVGLGLGTVTRSTTGALTVMAALLFVVPPLGRLLPEPWDARFFALSLPQLPQQLTGAADAYLSPLGALAALAAYVLVTLAAGAIALRVRDA